MRFSASFVNTALLAFSIGSGTSASFADLPACSQQCIADAIKSATTCAPTDTNCACANKDKIQQAGAQCVNQACGIDVAVNEVMPAVQKGCAPPS
ncbi:hypothetical protein BST61_g4044 [Cercospora zeina]